MTAHIVSLAEYKVKKVAEEEKQTAHLVKAQRFTSPPVTIKHSEIDMFRKFLYDVQNDMIKFTGGDKA